ncbi:fimbrial protein [Cupriavidus basilensis]|uniref:fimbrial protein n=1 Tax=Cupriavidus basilensis TaxID=68895 RepID=UPI0020A6BD01|nr:fimbrial protein [Cupriavidus basilensis]MCP3017735.1 fimbrial protein [Cupriavidus basilensis]
MQQLHQVLRGLAARLIPAIALVIVASISPKALAMISVTAFGTTVNVPNNLPAGTVISRYTIPLSQLCGAASSCRAVSITLYPYGGRGTSPGPLIPTNVSGLSARLLLNGQPVSALSANSGNYITVTSPLEVQLVRDGGTLRSDSLAGAEAGAPSYFGVCVGTSGGNCPGLAINLGAYIRLVNGSCSTPDQSVALPGMVLYKFKGVGSTGDQSSAKEFSLRFNNCPPGFARVGYTLTPIGGPLPALAGALPVAGGSTAKGVAIQLTGTNGTPATFNQPLPLSAYSSSTGGSYTVPMTARYIQTEATVTPGTISSMMSVLVDYQ